MCFSATVSLGAATVLLATGSYSIHQTNGFPVAYRMWALIPVLFGVQQGFEGGVWLSLINNQPETALHFALAFHFFSHFLWLWWIPLASSLFETHKILKKLFFGIAVFGFLSSGAVYMSLLLHPEWMHVHIAGHSIIYDFIMPIKSDIHLPFTPLMLYGTIILLPLLLSSHAAIRNFGMLVILSMSLAYWIHNAAFVSVWCFFAALISLYLVYMLQNLPALQLKK